MTYDEEKAASKAHLVSPYTPSFIRSSSLVDLFQSGKFSKNFQVKPPGELDQVQAALDKLLFMLKHLITYVDEILVCARALDHSMDGGEPLLL